MNSVRGFFIYGLALLFLSACSNGQSGAPTPAQKPDQPGTKLEAFLGKRGRILVKDSYALGQVSSMGSAELEGLVIYEPGSSQKIKGLRIEVTESGRLERSSISFIDLDELQSLSEALSYMSNLAAKWNGQTHDPYTEITYVSKGEFKVGFFQKGTKADAFVTSGLIGSATAFIKISDLDRLKTMVDQANTLLNSK
jgi:hypothetical protein